MKQIFAIGLLIAIMNCTGKKNELKFEIHNDLSGFSIKYPANWDTTKQDNRVRFMAHEISSDSTDKFNEGLNVSMFQLDGITLDDFVEKNIELTQQRYPNQKIEKKKGKNSNGIEFYSMTIEVEANGMKLINFGTFFSNKNQFYTLTQTIEKDKTTEYQPIVNEVVESFDWTRK